MGVEGKLIVSLHAVIKNKLAREVLGWSSCRFPIKCELATVSVMFLLISA